jgi:L-threonylcarbamoyladenylate synthase
MIISHAPETCDQIAAVIADGGVIAFRTDTFYGLGADPFNADAVQKIKQLKGREDGKPVLVVISDHEQLDRFINKPSPAFNHLSQTFWPGAVTLIGPAKDDVPAELTAGTKTIGLRLPNDDRVRALVRLCGGALTATSANPATAAPARDAQAVLNYFGESLAWIVDDGKAKTDRPSTVVDVSGTEPQLIREGVIPWAEISVSWVKTRELIDVK